MSLIIYRDGHNPDTPKYKFYGDSETLRFDQKAWIYYREMPDGTLQAQDGVTRVCHIIDKSEILMRWAVKKAIEKAKRLLMERGFVALAGEDDHTASLFEGCLDDILDSAKRADREEFEAAAETGTIAHDWIEKYIKAILGDNQDRRLELLAHLPVDERAANAVLASLDWMAQHNVRWIQTERKIFSRKYGYAGTLDGTAQVDSCDNSKCCPKVFKDRFCLIDWKSSNYLYLEYLLQTAAYQQAYQEETGEQIDSRWIIRLGKDNAEFDPWHVEGDLFVQDFNGFLDCLNLFRSVRAITERLDAITDAKKEMQAVEKQALKDAANQIACLKSDEYKGARKKKGCNGLDKMCQACENKWMGNVKGGVK